MGGAFGLVGDGRGIFVADVVGIGGNCSVSCRRGGGEFVLVEKNSFASLVSRNLS